MRHYSEAMERAIREVRRKQRREDLLVKFLAASILAALFAGIFALSYWVHDGDIKCMLNEKCRVVKTK